MSLSTANVQSACAETPFPSSPVIEAVGLDDVRRPLLDSLIRLPAKDKERAKTREALCPEKVNSPDSATQTVKAALAVVDTSISVEVGFEKGSVGKETDAQSFSVVLEFGPKEVLIRPTVPRYGSDAAGIWVPFPFNFTRYLWIEGKKGSDLLFMIPEVEECGIQAVVICPRTYVPRTTLATTTYLPTSAKYFVTSKADGLFAVNPGETGKIQASVLATKGIEIPDKWFKDDSTTTPSATMKFSTPKGETDPGPLLVTGTLPIVGSIEARLDFGKKDSVLRTVKSRSTIEIKQFDLPAGEKTTIRGAQLDIEPGACYQVTRWREQSL